MAVDIFLKIDGITGEARDKAHGGEIDVLSWSWGMTLKVNRGGGGPARSPEFDQLTVTKFVDRASAPLMTALMRATAIKSAKLVCRKAGGDKPLEFLKVDMSDVRIASVKSTGASADIQFTEQIVLDFSKVAISYLEQDANGAQKGGAVEAEFDLKMNR